MIKNYLLLFVFVGAFSAFSQISITYNNETQNLSGQTYQTTAPTFAEFDIPFHINNNTGETQRWRITRYRVNVPIGWKDGICWGHGTDPFGGICYTSDQMVGNPWTTTSGAGISFDLLNGEYGKLKATINPDDWVSGSAHYRYYVSNDGVNYLDSVDVVVDFTANTVAKEPFNVTIVPNPASDYIQITANNNDLTTFKIMDALGSIVFKEQFAGNKKINTSDFKSGIYFVVFDGPNGKSFTRKVIVRH